MSISTKISYSDEYLTKWWIALVACIFVASILISPLIPPMQSPDENDHIARAYLLSKGQIITSKSNFGISGGEINTGLIKFMESFSQLPFHAEIKVNQEQLIRANQIEWSNSKKFTATNGTSYYFPLIYIPQACALIIGEILNLTISNSYLLAKLFALVTSCVILYKAFSLWAPSLFTGALLIMPMSIYQFSSASIDGITTALTILCVSFFLRHSKSTEKISARDIFILSISLLLISTSRPQLLPCLLFLLFLFFDKNDKRILVSFFLTVFLSIAWTAFATKTSVDSRAIRDLSSLKILEYYLSNPSELLVVVKNTITNTGNIKSYATSFIGVLGWLDTSLPKPIYLWFGLALIILFVISLSNIKNIICSQNLTLLLCSALSIAIIFLGLLITWTPHPANTISGVQGRYFLIPALLIGYSLTTSSTYSSIRLRLVGPIILGVTFLLSGYQLNRILVLRFFAEEAHAPYLAHQFAYVAPNKSGLIKLNMMENQIKDPGEMIGLSVWLSSPLPNNFYSGEIFLVANDGMQYKKTFFISAPKNGGWINLTIPKNKYIDGSLRFEGQAQLTHREVSHNHLPNLSCLIYEYRDGTRIHTPNCND